MKHARSRRLKQFIATHRRGVRDRYLRALAMGGGFVQRYDFLRPLTQQ